MSSWGHTQRQETELTFRNSSVSFLLYWWGRSGYSQLLNSNYCLFNHSGMLQLRVIKAQWLWLIQNLLPLAFRNLFEVEGIIENQEKQSIKEIIIKIESWGRWTCDRESCILILLIEDLNLVDILASPLLFRIDDAYWICDAYFQWRYQQLQTASTY